MHLSFKSEYALIALTELARQKKSCSLSELAVYCGTSPLFLQQIFSELKRNKIVTSVLGRGGGFFLAKDPEKISLAEVVRIFDEVIAPSRSVSKFHYRPTPIEKNPKAVKVFQEIRDRIVEILEKKTILDLV